MSDQKIAVCLWFDHRLTEAADFYISVFGGKITTSRRLAEHALEKLLPATGREIGAGWTDRAPLPGGDFVDAAAFYADFSARHAYLDRRRCGLSKRFCGRKVY